MRGTLCNVYKLYFCIKNSNVPNNHPGPNDRPGPNNHQEEKISKIRDTICLFFKMVIKKLI